jgi:hypothetical protein
MAYYYFCKREKEYLTNIGAKTTCILVGGTLKEFTTTTDHPVHSADHQLVHHTELY